MDTLTRINPLYEKYGHLPLVALGIVLILLGLFIRTDFLISILNFVLELLGWLGIVGGTAIAAVGIAAFGNDKGWWDKTSAQKGDGSAHSRSQVHRVFESSALNAQKRSGMPSYRGMSSSILFVLIMMFFFLPWVSISCFGDEITASGMDIMAITEGDGSTLSDLSRDGDYTIADAIGSEAALIYLCFLLAISGAALFSARDKKGRYARAGIGAASFLFILLYMFLALGSLASELGVGIWEIEERRNLEVNWKIGIWLTLLGYLAVIAIQFVPFPIDEDRPNSTSEEN